VETDAVAAASVASLARHSGRATFYRAGWNADAVLSVDENSARLSVRPSVKRLNCDKTEEKSFQLLYHTKEHLA